MSDAPDPGPVEIDTEGMGEAPAEELAEGVEGEQLEQLEADGEG
jgi:hypothetical protein